MTYFGAVRHPLTENHHVIVDGVHASVHILNEQLYRKLSYPLQLTYWANSEWNRSWLVKKLVRLVQNGKEPFFTSSPTELLEYWTGSALPALLSSQISHWGPREFTAKEVIMFPNAMSLQRLINVTSVATVWVSCLRPWFKHTRSWYISSGISFKKVPQKAQNIRTRTWCLRFLVPAVRICTGGLLSWWLIVKLSPYANLPWVRKGSPCQFLGGGCCKSALWSVSLSGESIHWSFLYLKFVMPHSKFFWPIA